MAKAVRTQSDLDDFDLGTTPTIKKTTTPPPTPKVPEVRTYAFRLLKKISPMEVGGSEYQKYKSLPAVSLAYDENTDTTREVRFINGCKTFWVDEQVERFKITKEIADQKEWRPEFADGLLLLRSPQDQLKIDYMMARDEYDGKTVRVSGKQPVYTLENKEAQYVNKRQFQELKKKATDYALIATFEEAKQHAVYLGIKLANGYGDARDPEDVMADYYDKADKDPALFLKSYDSPVIKFKHDIKQALKDGVIDTTHVRGQAVWGDSKGLIKVLDMSKELVDDLSDFGFSDKGKEFYNKIKN